MKNLLSDKKALKGRVFSIFCLSVIALLCESISFGVPIYIDDQNKVPRWGQHHDFRAIYGNAQTDIPSSTKPGTWLTFSKLAADPLVKVRQVEIADPGPPPSTKIYNLPFYALNPAAPNRDFVPDDYYTGNKGGNDLAGGGWHCAPTSTGMWMEWLRAKKLSLLPDLKNEVASITYFANAADTSDINPGINKVPNVGHFGTYREDMVAAANAYVKEGYGFLPEIIRPRVVAWDFTPEGYKQLIDRNTPPVVFYQTNATGAGHVVVGIGYDNATNEAIFADPWESKLADRTKKKKLDKITPLNGGGSGVLYGADPDPPSSNFDDDWFGVRMQVMAIPDYGDALSPYIKKNPEERAVHLIGQREWLGDKISGEVNPLEAADDQDGIANVNDQDDFDDGIKFSLMRVGDNQGSVQAQISYFTGLDLDSLFEEDFDLEPILYLNGWVDWNQNFLWEDGNGEKIVDFELDLRSPDLGLDPDFEGLATFLVDLTFDIPYGVMMGDYWARFRLSHGKDVDAYGVAMFGEVEDYRVSVVPEPSTFLLLSAGLVGLGFIQRRRRKV